MKLFAAMLGLMLVLQPLNAQIAPFVRAHGETDVDDRGSASIQLQSGSIYLLGTSGTDISLSKLDAQGQLIWQTRYETPSFDFANNFVQAGDGSFVIAGESYDNATSNLDAVIFKVDTLGNEVWRRHIGYGWVNESFYSIDNTTDGGFVCSGFTAGMAGSGNDIYVVKFDGTGTEEWTQLYGGDFNEVGVAVKQTPDGGYILANDQQRPDGKYQIYMIKTDPSGNEVWNNQLSTPYNAGCKNMIINGEGNYVVAGESATPSSAAFDMSIALVSPDGEELWNRMVPATDFGEAAFDLMQTPEGQYLLTGYSHNPATAQTDIGVVYLDCLGNLLASRFYGYDGYDIAYDIIPSVYGGFIVTGGSTVEGDGQAIVIHDEMPFITGTGAAWAALPTPDFQISPNPAKAAGLIRFSAPLGSKASVEMYDLQGRKVHTFKNAGNAQTLRLPANLQNGIYLLRIAGEHMQLTEKVEILR